MEIESTTTQARGHSINGPEDAVVRLLEWIGEEPTREGLRDTPRRLVKAMRELCGGYTEDPATILARQFTEATDEMIVVDGIRFWSLCEHHMLPFSGTATVAYVPADTIVGLSKIPRLVHCFARRLQIQERLTQQIVDALMKHLRPLGAACIIRANHTCMQMRGVQSDGQMVTSCLRGVFKDDPRARAEFMAIGN